MQQGARLKEIAGNGQVETIRIQPRGEADMVLPVKGVFVYLQGNQPITDYLMGQLETTADGCLVVDSQLQTTVPGVFAVGDLLCTHIKQAVIAAADGVIAAIAVDRCVNQREKIRPDWR